MSAAPTQALPRISPEALFFLAGSTVRRAVTLPDESLAVAAAGVVHRMLPEEWQQYRVMCEGAAELVALMERELR